MDGANAATSHARRQSEPVALAYVNYPRRPTHGKKFAQFLIRMVVLFLQPIEI
jgi:hypothetical protein